MSKIKAKASKLETTLCALAVGIPLLVFGFGFTNAIIVRMSGGY